MLTHNIDTVFHLDSDCCLLIPIHVDMFCKKNAIIKNKNFENKFRMAGSIHSALLTKDYIAKYIQLFRDLYENKTKFGLIRDKVEFHKTHPGNICDMTLTYLLNMENASIACNLQDEHENGYVFNHHLSCGEGNEHDDQYEMINNNSLKVYEKINNNGCNTYYVFNKYTNKYVPLASMHFQGNKKHLLMYQHEINNNPYFVRYSP